jgi:hypothetical protein
VHLQYRGVAVHRHGPPVDVRGARRVVAVRLGPARISDGQVVAGRHRHAVEVQLHVGSARIGERLPPPVSEKLVDRQQLADRLPAGGNGGRCGRLRRPSPAGRRRRGLRCGPLGGGGCRRCDRLCGRDRRAGGRRRLVPGADRPALVFPVPRRSADRSGQNERRARSDDDACLASHAAPATLLSTDNSV